MPESVYFFWGVVAVLALAAALNHGWHHTRQTHLAARLARVSYRDGGPTVLAVELDADIEGTPGA